MAKKPENKKKHKRKGVIVLLIALGLILLFALSVYILTIWTPLQKLALKKTLRFLKIEAEIDFDNLDFWLNYIYINNLEFSMKDGSLSIELDSLQAWFSIENMAVSRLAIWNPSIKIGESKNPSTPQNKNGKSSSNKIKNFTIDTLNISNGYFYTDGFSLENFSYLGSMGYSDKRIELNIDSVGALLPGRGRLIQAAGELTFDEILEMDINLILARSSLDVKGQISSFDPFEWHFIAGGEKVDLVEIDSILGLGFLVGHGKVRIDLSGGDDYIEGNVYIDGEIFDIPAQKTSTRLIFKDQKLSLPNIHGGAWGAQVSASVSLDFSEKGKNGIGLSIDGTAQGFNLNAFIPDGSLPTSLTGKTKIDGRIMDGAVELLIHSSLADGSILNYPFNEAAGSLFVSEDSVRFYPGFEVLSGGNFFSLGGVIVFDDEIYIEFGLWARDVSKIAGWFGLQDVIGGRLRLENGKILGDINHPILSLDIMSDSLVTAFFQHDHLSGDVTLYDIAKNIHGDIYLLSEGAIGPLGYDSLLTNVEIHGNRYYVKPLRMWGDTLSVKGIAEIFSEDDSMGIQIEGLDLVFIEQPVILDSAFTISLVNDKITSSPILAQTMGGELIVKDLHGTADNFSFNAVLENLQFEKLGKIIGSTGIEGNIGGSMLFSSGNGGTGNFKLNIEDFTTSGLRWDEAKIEGFLNAGILTIEPLLVSRKTERYVMNGTVDLKAEKIPFSMEIHGKGERVEALPPFVWEVDSIVGPFDITVSASGNKDSLFMEGGFNWRKGTLGLRDMADPIENMNVQLTLDGDNISIDSLSGMIGALPIESKSIWERVKRLFTKNRKQYGTFSARGNVDISNPTNPKPNINFKAKALPLNFPEDGIFARLNADIDLISDKKMRIDGRIDVDYANIVKLETGGGNGGSGEIPLDLNIVLNLPRNININTTLLESEISGKVNILTENNQLALYGDLSVIRGKVFFYGQTFRIEEGSIGFRTFKGINPTMDIIAISRVGQTRIVIHVTGELETPTISLYAEDQDGSRLPYDQRQIISILAFRTEGGSTDSTGFQVSDLIEERLPQVVQSYISREFENVARTTLGVETFEFEPSDENVFDFSQANVTIGKYLTDKIYLKYTRSLSFDENSEDIINLQYRITDVISIEAQRETGPEAKENYRLDLKFKWEY
ncbi:translocation/assembly module TamB [bacterium]|nr:translocation/assembly module TamB [bacterium]